MGLLRRLSRFRQDNRGTYAMPWFVLIAYDFGENRVYINSATFGVCINGKSHRVYNSKKLPKYINVRARVFC